jgi:hypothetical protein
MNWKAQWIGLLASIIADACNCRVLMYGKMTFRFIGTEDAIQSCSQTMEYMFHCAKRFGVRAETEERKKLGRDCPSFLVKGFKNSYRLGFIHRLQERYKEEASKIRTEYSGSTALVRLTDSLRLADEYIDKQILGKRRTHRSNINPFGYQKGRDKADEINMSGPSIESDARIKHLPR